jgi:hypothetical protein
LSQAKLGKKHELVDRAIRLLHRPDTQAQVILRVREIQKSQQRSFQPYTYSSPSGNITTSKLSTSSSKMSHYPTNSGLHRLTGSSSTGNYDPRYAQYYGGQQNPYGMQQYGGLMGNPGVYGHNFTGMPQMQQTSGLLVRNLRTTNLPFYDVKQVSY